MVNLLVQLLDKSVGTCKEFLRRTGLLIALVYLSAGSLSSQAPKVNQTATPAIKLEFEVASVRQNKSDADQTESFPLGPGDVFVQTGGSFSFTNYPLISYIAFAYKFNPAPLAAMQHQLPGWVTADRFDIQAKTDKRDATKDEVRMMMRALLADRFKLTVHEETKQVPVFALVLVKPEKTGPQLRPHPAESPCTADPTSQPETSPTFPLPCGGNVALPPDAPGQRKMGGRNITLDTLIIGILNWGGLGRPLLDQTGLEGKYDFSIAWTPDSIVDASPDATGPSFRQALAEQLGLKLVATRGPSTSLIIDRVERPSEN